MPEIILELSLNRSSGVLAGIVASLAQAGIELQSQKLQRATEGRGGGLTIVGSGDSPDPAMLAERFNGTRGVEKLMRVIVDGEAVLAEGKPLEDQIQHDDLAELSAGSGTRPDQDLESPEPPLAPNPERQEQAGGQDIEDLPILSEPEGTAVSPHEPEPERASDPEPEPESESVRPADEPEIIADPVEQDLEAAPGSIDDEGDDPETPEFAAEPTAESDLAAAMDGGDETDRADEAFTQGEDEVEGSGAAQVGAVLRRRRRRRR